MDGPTPPPARVLHVFGRLERGGAEMRFVELIMHLPPREFSIDVCALSGLAGTLDPTVRSRGGQVVPLRLNSSFPARFLKLLRAGRYRVVHSHVLYASGPILALARLARVPIRVAHFHSTTDGRCATSGRRLARAAMRWLLDRSATDIVAVGEGAMEAIWGSGWRDDGRCRVVYNGVDRGRFDSPVDEARLRTELGTAGAGPVFVHVGNELAPKNHGRLVEIFAEILRTAPSARLVLIGRGTDDPAGITACRTRELGLEHAVVALGVRHDVPDLLRVADVLILPSLHEGLPGVVLEACAAGLPALATDLPGVREIAARLPLVRMLPLSADDREWARVAIELPCEAARLHLRDRAADAIRGSVFDVGRFVEAHCDLWHGRRERIAC